MECDDAEVPGSWSGWGDALASHCVSQSAAATGKLNGMASRATKRERAEAMRARGATYNDIVAATGIAKSTLSYWFTGRHVRIAARAGQSQVYFIQAEHGGPVKIGTAAAPERRLAELQCGNPDALVLRATIDGDELTERDLHDRYAEHHIRGEWFWPSVDLEREVGVALGAAELRVSRCLRPVPIRLAPVVVALAQHGGWLTAAELRTRCTLPAYCSGTLATLRNRGWVTSLALV